jgi:hypothetical protein
MRRSFAERTPHRRGRRAILPPPMSPTSAQTPPTLFAPSISQHAIVSPVFPVSNASTITCIHSLDTQPSIRRSTLPQTQYFLDLHPVASTNGAYLKRILNDCVQSYLSSGCSIRQPKLPSALVAAGSHRHIFSLCPGGLVQSSRMHHGAFRSSRFSHSLPVSLQFTIKR